jgi:transmembrane sensor
MKELKELHPIPDQILHFLTQNALGRLQNSDLRLLKQWMEQNPEKLGECNAFMDQVRKYYWIFLSENIKEPQDIIERLILKNKPKSKIRKLALHLLPYAATLLVLAGFAWYLFNLASDKESAITQAEATFPERHNKAVLVLSDGNSLVLDNHESIKMPEENGVRITNQPGEFLRYELDKAGSDSPRMNRLIVPAGARYQIQLADGTKVWMNSRSELEYPVAFSSNSRRVILSGEAYFEVHTDASAPFIIEANGYEISVTGTAFNISAYADDEFMQTTLVTGALEVSSREGSAYKLYPGQMAMIKNQSQEAEIEYVDTRLFTSWRDGVLHFNKISLKDLATRLERWYDVEIQFANDHTADLLFSGAMENSRDIGFLLNLIGKAANVEFEINEKQITVK